MGVGQALSQAPMEGPEIVPTGPGSLDALDKILEHYQKKLPNGHRLILKNDKGNTYRFQRDDKFDGGFKLDHSDDVPTS
jgi:hypothetical protein